jgi:hypothetical protein
MPTGMLHRGDEIHEWTGGRIFIRWARTAPPACYFAIEGLSMEEWGSMEAALKPWASGRFIPNRWGAASPTTAPPSLAEWPIDPDVARAVAFWLTNPGVRDVPLKRYLKKSGFRAPHTPGP